MIPKVLQRDIDNLVNSEQFWALATYLVNYAQDETGDTESVFFYALAKVGGVAERKREGGLIREKRVEGLASNREPDQRQDDVRSIPGDRPR